MKTWINLGRQDYQKFSFLNWTPNWPTNRVLAQGQICDYRTSCEKKKNRPQMKNTRAAWQWNCIGTVKEYSSPFHIICETFFPRMLFGFCFAKAWSTTMRTVTAIVLCTIPFVLGVPQQGPDHDDLSHFNKYTKGKSYSRDRCHHRTRTYLTKYPASFDTIINPTESVATIRQYDSYSEI